MIPVRYVNEALARAFVEYWGVVAVRREVVALADIRSTIRTVRADRLRNAHAVLARQLAAAAAVGRAMVANRHQAALLDRLDSRQHPARRPAYVDCVM